MPLEVSIKRDVKRKQVTSSDTRTEEKPRETKRNEQKGRERKRKEEKRRETKREREREREMSCGSFLNAQAFWQTFYRPYRSCVLHPADRMSGCQGASGGEEN